MLFIPARPLPSTASHPTSTTRTPRASAWLAALAVSALPLVASAQAGVTPPPQNVMSLQASATAEVTMDVLSIAFGTTKDGADAAAVQSQLKQALDAALTEARRVAKPGQVDVRTGNFSLTPRYAQKGGITGWQGTASLIVEGRDMTAISQLAGKIQTLSITRVGYGLARETCEKLEAETTAQAIARFRERAQAQAALFGFTGFSIREVQVSSEGGSMPMPQVMRARVAGAPMMADEALPVEAGKTTVSSSVSGSVQMTR